MEFDLKEKDTHELLKLEELFHSHYLTEELINGMINLYVKFAENIRKNQHPLRLFFMEKIKFVLSRSEVIRILQKSNNQQTKKSKETSRQTVGLTQDEEAEIKKMKEEAKQEIRQNHMLITKKDRKYPTNGKSDQLQEKQRNMQIEMQIQIMEQVQKNMIEMKRDFNNNAEANKKKEINKIFEKQEVALNERLANRRRKLKKKSVQLTDKEVIQIETPTLQKKELLEMKKELHQTYERFTRLTMKRTKRVTQVGQQNQGRVKVKVDQQPIFEQDIFDELQKQKKDATIQSKNELQFHKAMQATPQQKLQQIKEVKVEVKERQGDSSVEYKPYDQNKGRVTIRQKKYQSIEEDQMF